MIVVIRRAGPSPERGSGARPHLTPVPLVSHLDPRLQHTYKNIFENAHPLVIFGPPCSEILTTGLPQVNWEEPCHHLGIENFRLIFFITKMSFSYFQLLKTKFYLCCVPEKNTFKLLTSGKYTIAPPEKNSSDVHRCGRVH